MIGLKIVAEQVVAHGNIVFLQLEGANRIAATVDRLTDGDENENRKFAEVLAEALAIVGVLNVIAELFDVAGEAGHIGHFFYVDDDGLSRKEFIWPYPAKSSLLMS